MQPLKPGAACICALNTESQMGTLQRQHSKDLALQQIVGS